MSVLFADRDHLDESTDDAEVEAIFAAIRDLPPESQEEVQRSLARVVKQYAENRRVDPVIHFIESLMMTARLHRNPRYGKALAEAKTVAEPLPDAMDRDALERRLDEFLSAR